jgi:hypothetical protein
MIPLLPNSTTDSAETLAKNMIFCGGFGTIGGTIRGTIYFPSSPRNTNTKEHQHPLINQSISIVVGLFIPNTNKLPKFAPVLLSSLAALAALAALATTSFLPRPSSMLLPWPSLPSSPSLP